MPTPSRLKKGLVALAIGSFACSGACDGPCDGDPDPPPPAPTELVQVDAWDRVADPTEDVFGAERPADEVCDEVLGILVESLGGTPVLEIDTDSCNYATVSQPSLLALQPGDTVAIEVWHYDLTAADPGQAHLALAIDGEVAWEEYVPVPSAAALIEAEIAIDREVPAGAALQFHVHNHGANTYDLAVLELVPDDPTTGAPRSAPRSAPR